VNLITTRDLRNHAGKIWERLAQQEDLIVTSRGRPIALLSPIVEDDVEKTLAILRRARAQVAVSRMREAAAAADTSQMTLEEINAEVRMARQDRLE
jgi:prevent-host-death family protein